MASGSSFRNRLFSLFLVFSLTPIFVVSLGFLIFAARGARENIRNLTVSEVRTWAENFTSRKEQVEQMLETLGDILPMGAREKPDSLVQLLTKTLLQGRSGVGQILVGNTREPFPRLVIRIRGYNSGDEPRWTYYTQEELRENWAYLWALPLRDYYRYRRIAPEKPLQALGLRYTLQGPVLRYMAYLGGGDVLLADVELSHLVPSQTVVISQEGFIVRHPNPTLEGLSLREVTGIRLENLGGGNLFVLASRIGGALQKVDGFYFMAYQPLDPFYRPLLRFLWAAVALAAALAGLSFLAAFVLSRVLTRDVEHLTEAVVRVAKGDFNVEVKPVRTGDELKVLADSIRQMIRKLREFYEKITYSEPLVQIGELSAGIAHEVRNPLNGISSCADAIRKLSQHPRVHVLTQEIQREVQRLDRLVQDILILARPTVPCAQRVNLQGFLRSLRGLWSQDPQFQAKGLSLEIDIPDGIVVYADPDHMEQILWNLVGNAIDFSPMKGRITLRTRREDIWVWIEVEDQGPGVPVEHRQLIFRPFFTQKKHGAGLGLTIVKRLVELNGGKIWVEDAPDGGARFVFYLPAEKEGRNDPGAPR